MASVWGLLCDARNRSGLSVPELATIVGIEAGELDDFEHARSLPSIEILYAIVAACGLEMRIQLHSPDQQRHAMRQASRERSIEDRIGLNESAACLTKEFRRSGPKDYASKLWWNDANG